MTALSFMSTESEIFKTFDQIAIENFFYNQISQVNNIEELEKVKATSKERLLEEIGRLEELTNSEKREYKINRDSTLLKETEKIKKAIN